MVLPLCICKKDSFAVQKANLRGEWVLVFQKYKGDFHVKASEIKVITFRKYDQNKIITFGRTTYDVCYEYDYLKRYKILRILLANSEL